MQLRWTESALADLENIADYLKQQTPMHAERLARIIYRAPEALTRTPLLGRRGCKPGSRELVLAPLPWIIVYSLRQTRSIFSASSTERRNGRSQTWRACPDNFLRPGATRRLPAPSPFTMKKPTQCITALFGAALLLAPAYALPSPQSDNGTTAKQDMRNAGHETKDAARDTGHGVKHGTKHAWHKTKRGTKKAWHKTRNTTRGAYNGGKEGAHEPASPQ